MGDSPVFRTPFIDLSIPRQLAPYDKTGSKLLVDALKVIFFGSASTRMTAGRCAKFFDTEANFVR